MRASFRPSLPASSGIDFVGRLTDGAEAVIGNAKGQLGSVG